MTNGVSAGAVTVGVVNAMPEATILTTVAGSPDAAGDPDGGRRAGRRRDPTERAGAAGEPDGGRELVLPAGRVRRRARCRLVGRVDPALERLDLAGDRVVLRLDRAPGRGSCTSGSFGARMNAIRSSIWM